MKNLNFSKYLAELIGTFVLVVIGCGTAIATGCVTGWPNANPAAYVATAGAFGLAIVAMAYSIGNISGCHINPAVSLAMFIHKKLSLTDLIGYVIAQCLGAILGAVLLGMAFGWDCGYGANAGAEGVGKATAFGIEAILTFIFVLTILGVTARKDYSGVAGLVIGGTLTMVHLLGIAFTGTSVNPARSLGPAIFAGGAAFAHLWIFLVAPLVGGAAAALAWRYIFKQK